MNKEQINQTLRDAINEQISGTVDVKINIELLIELCLIALEN